jgi:hypothetical protein
MRSCCGCDRSPPAIRFAGLSTRICTACQAERRAGRASRLEITRIAPPRLRQARQREGADPAYLAWVRSLPCAVPGCRSAPPQHAHHVRVATGGGTGMKPPDRWATPLCGEHHAEGHKIGWRTFEARHGVDLRALSDQLYAVPPAQRGLV